jgi:hypothetical protein
VLTIQVSLLTPTQLLQDPAADAGAKDRYQRMRLEALALPGVTEVGLGSPMPLRRSDVRFEVKAEGKVFDAREAPPRAELRTADPLPRPRGSATNGRFLPRIAGARRGW